MDKKRPTTYENEVLAVLAYEFPSSTKTEAEAKIKARLKRKKLGAFDAERVGLLRKLKDDLQVEIGKAQQSKYHTGMHGKYVDVSDFDVERLTADIIQRYPQIAPIEIESFVPFCILIYYLL